MNAGGRGSVRDSGRGSERGSAMDFNNTILEIRGLSISFSTSRGRVRAVQNLDLTLPRGRTLAVVGESGSGKSVTARAIIGILAPNGSVDAGAIRYRDHDGVERDLLAMKTRDLRREINGRRIAMIFQDPMTTLNPTIPVGAQIAEGMVLHGRASRKAAAARAVELLATAGIEDAERRARQYPHQLSGGMRQRVAIAIALACDPEVLICDEVTTALDVTVQARVLRLIQEIQARTGISVIFITHDLGVVARVADFVNVMYAGRIVERGTAEEIFCRPRHPYTWGLLLATPGLRGPAGDGDATGTVTVTATKNLYAIPGSPPDLLRDIPGDPFAPRNPYALKIDFRRPPPFFRLSPTHEAATWLLHDKAPVVPMPAELRTRIEAMMKEAQR